MRWRCSWSLGVPQIQFKVRANKESEAKFVFDTVRLMLVDTLRSTKQKISDPVKRGGSLTPSEQASLKASVAILSPFRVFI